MNLRFLLCHYVALIVLVGEAYATDSVPSSSPYPVDGESAQLHVLVKGIRDEGGSLTLDIPSVKSDGARFKELPAGYYAIALYHDKNDNGELDTNIFGIPEESYGFSRNAEPLFSSPSFKEAAFRLRAGQNLRLVIDMQPF
ncbi:MAG: DUF2141 domain-containing protein [Alphaproteobacteria bacterium GM7ARS4]|nr:DUF2141 domain-containing protein [Alphaproteobacteria bacterium GM7ARS4]